MTHSVNTHLPPDPAHLAKYAESLSHLVASYRAQTPGHATQARRESDVQVMAGADLALLVVVAEFDKILIALR